MTNPYSEVEIVELGIVIEQNGRDFYNNLISLSEDKNVQLAFEYLAKEEEKHIQYFQKMLRLVQDFMEKEGNSTELYSHMRSLADEHVFSKENTGKAMAEGIHSATEAIDMGIRFEKESIQLYEEMRKIVPEAGQKVVNSLIEEEQRHLNKLKDLKATVK